MDYKNLSIIELKEIIYNQQFQRFPYLKEFKKNPYSYLKGRYYMFCSIYLVYFFLKTRITPNMVTVAYCFCGVIGSILLSIPNYYLNILGVFVFFNKSILDWSDGHLARIKYKATLTGHILDVYGGVLNSIGLTVGLGFFAFNQSSHEFLIYLIVVSACLNSEVYTSVGKKLILESLDKLIFQTKSNGDFDEKKYKEKSINESIKIKYPKWLNYFKKFLDDRSRNVDFILLIIIIDICYNFHLTFYLFLIIFFRILIRFISSFFFGVKSKWAEQFVEDLKKENL